MHECKLGLSWCLRVQDFQALMSTNLGSAFALCQLFQPLLKADNGGCIVFNSSVAGGPTCLRWGDVGENNKAMLKGRHWGAV